MIPAKKSAVALILPLVFSLSSSSLASHNHGYPEWIFLDEITEWVNSDRLTACETYKNSDLIKEKWGDGCQVGGERTDGPINRGCHLSDPDNVDGKCESELVFCRLVNCPRVQSHIIVPIGMTAFRCEAHGYSYNFITDTCVRPASDPGKSLGKSCQKPGTTNPCNPVTGNKFHEETDYTGSGPFPLEFQRFYNSIRPEPAPPAANWRHTYQRSIHTSSVTLVGSEAKVARSDGQVLTFSFLGGAWVSDPDVVERLEEELDDSDARLGWTFTDSNDTVESYDDLGRLVAITNRDGFTQTLIYDDISGRLKTVTDPFGRALEFAYDPDGRLATITDPADNPYRYEHDTIGNLSAVFYPDDTPDDVTDNPSRTYHYDDVRFPYHLTRIIDENGHVFSNVAYDDQGRATLSEQQGGINRISIRYDTDGTSTVTDALGNDTVYEVKSVYSVFKTTGLTQPCALCQNKNASSSYDDYGFPASTTDFNGNLTTFEFNERGLETSRTEASGTPDSRTITTEWHPTLRRPAKITEPGRGTSFTYDDFGRLLSRTVTDPATNESRTTWRTYTPEGLLESIDGPRTDAADVTTFKYESGNLTKTTNALGHATIVDVYDAQGRPLTIIDPNGTITELSYDARNRLVTRAVAGSLTRFEYDNAGNVIQVTLPDESFLAQEYDPANRLIGLTDNLGNRVTYTLDALGNRVEEQTFDLNGLLTRQMSRVYNMLNRLTDELGAENQTTNFSYDAQGNVIAVVDPNNRWTASSYDALNRLTETLAPDDGITRFEYDARDNLIAVTDPRSLRTDFIYNGFNEVIETVSPDTGRTVQRYDEAGNRLSTTDARGITAKFGYDALNRLTAIEYPDPSENVFFEYDLGPNGIGRLTRISDQAGTIDMAYDARGNVVSETRTIDGIAYSTSYAYDLADRLIEMTYPSGLVVSYARDSLGRVSAVTAQKDGVDHDVATGLEYASFGPLTALTFGNGIQLTRTLDQDYRLAAQSAGAVQDLVYEYDPASNISVIQDNVEPNRSQYFGYDEVNRLTSAQGDYGTREYTYDGVGNRLTRTAGVDADVHIDDYFYSATSNQLDSVSGPNLEIFVYDASGNTVQKGPSSYIYNDANRFESVQTSGQLIAEYTYNAKGERVKKVVAGETTIFHYDQAGNLLAEFDGEGNPLRDYIWLDGERLAIVAGGADVSFAGTDPKTGEAVTLGLFLEDQTVEIRNGDGVSRQYTLSGKEWKASKKGKLKLKFKGEEIQFKGKLDLDALEGSLKIRGDGGWESYGLAGTDAGTAGPQGLFFIHGDHLGTPKAITDKSQNVVWEASHTPFGTALITVNEIENNLRFPGQFFDGETDSHYNYFRVYIPKTGRFLESDPLGILGGSQNYAYVGSNPVSSVDPLGLCRIEIRFNELFSLGNFQPSISVSHAFIVTTNIDGSEKYYRGGPSGLGLFGNWGTIETETGLYLPGTPDFPSDDLPRLAVVDDDKDCACYDEALKEAIDKIEDLTIPYNPLGSNSNTTVSNALRSIGLSALPNLPPSISVPGWFIKIPGLELEPSVCCK